MNKRKPSDQTNPLNEILIEIVNGLNWILIKFIQKGVPYIAKKVCEVISGRKELRPIEKEMTGKLKKQTVDVNDFGFSVNGNYNLKFKDMDFSRNTFIVGASGWGKSYMLQVLIEYQLQSAYPLVLIDPKGSMGELNTFRRLCSFYNRKLHVFSDTYVGPEARCFNPIRELDDAQIVSVLMRSLDWEGADPYYYAQAQNFLFEVVNEITKLEQVPSIPKIYKSVVEKYGDNKDAQGLISKLRVLCEGRLGELLSDEDHNPATNMNDSLNEGNCLYIGVSTQSYGSMARTLGRLFTNEVLQISAKRNATSTDPRKEFVPFTVFFDEAGSVIVSDFLDLINKSRSSGVQIFTATQSFFDFERAMKDITVPLTECYSTYLISRQTNPKATDEIAQFIGTVESIKETRQTNDDSETGGGSKREVEKYRVHPNIFRDIAISQVVYVQFGNKKEVHLVNVRDTHASEAFKTEIQEPEVFKYKRKYKRTNSLVVHGRTPLADIISVDIQNGRHNNQSNKPLKLN